MATQQEMALRDALQYFIDITYLPERNCSCHISPPCSWCTEYSALAEAHEIARAALANTAKGEKKDE